MYSERVGEVLRERGHDAVHVSEIALGGAPDQDVLAPAVEERRTLVTENAVDFLPLRDQRQSAAMTMTPVLVALTARRGIGGASMRNSRMPSPNGPSATRTPTPTRIGCPDVRSTPPSGCDRDRPATPVAQMLTAAAFCSRIATVGRAAPRRVSAWTSRGYRRYASEPDHGLGGSGPRRRRVDVAR